MAVSIPKQKKLRSKDSAYEKAMAEYKRLMYYENTTSAANSYSYQIQQTRWIDDPGKHVEPELTALAWLNQETDKICALGRAKG